MQGLLTVDGNILLFIQENIRNPVLTPIMKAITHIGDHGLFWILLTVALLIFPKTRKAGLCSFLALACSYLLNNLFLKNVVGRIRPYEVINELELMVGMAKDASFPSGHAASSFASAVAIYRSGQIPKKYGIVLFVLAALIGLSRLYVGIHYPTDVLMGTVSGIACGFVGAWLCRMIVEKVPPVSKYM